MKVLMFLYVLIFICLLTSCGSDPTRGYIEPDDLHHNDEVLTSYIEVKLIDIYGNSILVEPTEGYTKFGDRLSVNVEGISIGFNLIVGQTLGISYTGDIAESYPAQVLGTVAVELIEDVKTPQADEDKEVWGIEFTTKNVTPKGLTLVCTQNGGEDVTELVTGSFYNLEVLKDGDWVVVEYAPQQYDIAWTSEAWIIPLNGVAEWDVNWEWLYGELPAGEYRIGKKITGIGGLGLLGESMVYGYFEIV